MSSGDTAGVASSGRNYFTVAAFAPERCHERNRKQAGFAQLEMRDRAAHATSPLTIEAGRTTQLALSAANSKVSPAQFPGTSPR